MSNLTDADKVLRNDTGISIANRLSEIAATLDSQGGTSLAATDIADLYDNTKTYIVGDYVINNQALYRCIEDITAPEDFDSTKWRAIKIMSAVNEEIDAAISPLLPVDEAQGDIATFETNLAEPLQSVKCSINPIQNGTPWIDSNEVNKEPYIKRAVAGTASRIGNHLYDKLVGGSFAFNQLAPLLNTTNYSNDASTASFSDGVVSSSEPTARYASVRMRNATTSRAENGDKILLSADVKIGWNGKPISVYYNNGTRQDGFSGMSKPDYTPNVWHNLACIISIVRVAASTNGKMLLQDDNADYSGHEWQAKNMQWFNLTAMFGSTIADYIYSLEQATAGAGVAWFKALFPNDYYAYNAGELMSVKATAHVMKNASNTVIGNYPLDSNLELRGIPKLVNNKLEYDGDIYESSGDVTRRLSSVTLDGNINPNNLGVTVLDNYTQVSYMPYINIGVGAHSPFLCDKHFIHTAKPSAEIKEGDIYNSGVESAPRMFLALPKTVTTAAEAVAWFANNPTTVLFYIATPTTESASPFTNPQVCDENGTEEYTDNRAVAIPVGHETYQANICEITGFDELNIQQTGVNIWDEEWENGDISSSTGEKITGSLVITKNFISVKPNTVCYSNITLRTRWYDAQKNYIGTNPTITANATFTVPANAHFLMFTTQAGYGSTYNNDISINYPSTDTTYHAYNGDTVTIAFGQTVYGGVLDVTRGKLHITHEEVDLGSLDWYVGACSLENKYTMRSEDIANIVLAPPSSSIIVDILCSIYPTNSGDTTFLGNTGISILRGGTIAVFDDRYSTIDSANAFKSAMSGKIVVYPLATPFDIDLTPVQIEQLLGKNNVWHDANGDTEVKYKDSIQHYIDKKIASI